MANTYLLVSNAPTVLPEGAANPGATTQTVIADSFATDDGWIVFKKGGVVVKAVREWQWDSVELVEPVGEDDNSNS